MAAVMAAVSAKMLRGRLKPHLCKAFVSKCKRASEPVKSFL